MSGKNCSVCENFNTKLCSNCCQASYCSVTCQKLDRKTHKKYCYPFKVEEVEGKGKGLIATRTIEPGQQVLLDKCIISLNRETYNEPDSVIGLQLRSKVEKLSTAEKKEFYSLKSRRCLLPSLIDKFVELSIFYNNGICLMTSNEEFVCVFPKLSLINHSCAPNCLWSQVKSNETDKMEILALVRIEKGEELTCSYFCDQVKLIFAEKICRQKHLGAWDFECRCTICSLTGDALYRNEKNRSQLRKIVSEIDDERDEKRKAFLCCEKLVMIKDMGHELMVELSNAYEDAYLACARSDDLHLASKAAAILIEWKQWVNKYPLNLFKKQYASNIKDIFDV